MVAYFELIAINFNAALLALLWRFSAFGFAKTIARMLLEAFDLDFNLMV